MADKDKVTLTKNDGSGAGMIVRRSDVKAFLAANPDYAEEAQAKAVERAPENKAVERAPEKKARG